jgi:hypothetical protein
MELNVNQHFWWYKNYSEVIIIMVLNHYRLFKINFQRQMSSWLLSHTCSSHVTSVLTHIHITMLITTFDYCQPFQFGIYDNCKNMNNRRALLSFCGVWSQIPESALMFKKFPNVKTCILKQIWTNSYSTNKGRLIKCLSRIAFIITSLDMHMHL